jgi:hypothetical protein
MSEIRHLTKQEKSNLAESFTMLIEWGNEDKNKKHKKQKATAQAASVKTENEKRNLNE